MSIFTSNISVKLVVAPKSSLDRERRKHCVQFIEKGLALHFLKRAVALDLMTNREVSSILLATLQRKGLLTFRQRGKPDRDLKITIEVAFKNLLKLLDEIESDGDPQAIADIRAQYNNLAP